MEVFVFLHKIEKEMTHTRGVLTTLTFWHRGRTFAVTLEPDELPEGFPLVLGEGYVIRVETQQGGGR